MADDFRRGSHGTIEGHRAVFNKKPRQFETGRVCAEDGCETTLSRYNKKKLCWMHQPPDYIAPCPRGAKKRDEALRVAQGM